MDGLRRENNLDKYEVRLQYIMSEFVRRDAPSQINLGYFDRLETEKQASAVLDALSKKVTQHLHQSTAVIRILWDFDFDWLFMLNLIGSLGSHYYRLQ